MKTKWIERAARPAEVVMVLAVMLWFTAVAQFLALQAGLALCYRPFRADPVGVDVNDVSRPQVDIQRAGKVFLLDGRFVLTYQETPLGQLGQTRLTVMEPNSRVLYQGPVDKQPLTFMDWSSGDDRNEGLYQRTTGHRNVAYELTRLGEVTPEFSRTLTVPLSGPDRRVTGTWWYDPRRRVFEGRDIMGRPMGTMGSSGFSTEATSVQPFDRCVDLLSGHRPNQATPLLLFVGRQTLYRIDLAARQVETLVRADSPIRVHRCHWDTVKHNDVYRPSLAVFTGQGQVTILLEDPNEVIRCSIPTRYANHPTPPMVVATRDRVFMQVMETAGLPDTQDQEVLDPWRTQSRDREQQHTIRLLEVGRDGAVQEVSSFSWAVPGSMMDRQMRDWQTRFARVQRAVNIVSPPAVQHCLSGITDTQRRAMPTYLGETLGSMWHIRSQETPWKGALCSVGLALVALVHAWPRRTGWSRLAFWVVLVLAFNLAGLLTYLALNHTTVIRCSACGRRRGLLTPDCPACHSPLPVPQTKSTDLIVPAG